MDKNLPNDIVKYVKKKVARCVVIFAALGSASIGISVLSWQYFTGKTNAIFHICILLLLGIIPFWVSKFPWILIDRSWIGTVIDISIEQKTGTYTVGGGKSFPYDKNIIFLKVRKDNGKEVYIPAREFGIRSHAGFPVPNEGDVAQHLNEYSLGDTVYHFYGLKYNYIVKKNSEMIDCIVCGSQNQKERSACLSCGHTLVIIP